jgi:hypothetical protein
LLCLQCETGTVHEMELQPHPVAKFAKQLEAFGFAPLADEHQSTKRAHCKPTARPRFYELLVSPLRVRRENVILCLHDRMAREPALGVVRLRRVVG